MISRSARFSTSDLDWFARVSDDRNPLHVDEDFARKSAFGGRVVHGILTALTALAEIPARKSSRLRRVVLEFQRPVFTDVDYTVAVDDARDGKQTFRLQDGSLLHLRGMVEHAAANVDAERPSDVFGSPEPCAAARDWPADQLEKGVAVSIRYGMPPEAYREVQGRFALEGRGIAPWQAIVLIGASYVVGMHLPGARALFSRLQLDFSDDAEPRGPITFDCEIKTFDVRIHVARIGIRVRAGENVIAAAELQAFARRHSSVHVASADGDAVLAGKVAVIIGASRGLGASLASAMAARGATVLGTFTRSTDDAAALESAARALPGTIEMLRGDGRSAEFCEELKQRVTEAGRTLDFLFCNASPSVRPLWLEASARERIHDYVADSLRLFETPLTTLLSAMTHGAGWVVTSSSSAVREPVAEWPHYVAAKSAIEGLVHVAAKEYPALSFVILRPPALLTDFAPNLGSLQRALPPEQVARAVVSRLLAASAGGRVETLEAF